MTKELNTVQISHHPLAKNGLLGRFVWTHLLSFMKVAKHVSHTTFTILFGFLHQLKLLVKGITVDKTFHFHALFGERPRSKRCTVSIICR